MEYKNKHIKIFEKEYENQFNDYELENEEEKQKFINEKLSNLRLHKLIKQIELSHLLWDFDASVYIQVLCGMKSQYNLELKLGMLLQEI